MKKYYVDSFEVSQYIFYRMLKVHIEDAFPNIGKEDFYTDIANKILNHIDNPAVSSYLLANHLFKITEEAVKEPKIEVDPNYNPCEGCQWYNKPYLSITNPCEGCSAYKARWGIYTTVSQPASVSFEVTGTTNPANYKGGYVIHNNHLDLNIGNKSKPYEPSPMEALVDAALNRKK